MPIVLMLLTTLVTLYLRTERKIALLALTVAALLGCGWHGWSLWAIIPSALLLGLARRARREVDGSADPDAAARLSRE